MLIHSHWNAVGSFVHIGASVLHGLTCINLHIQFTSSNICNKMPLVTGVPLYIYKSMYVYNVWLLDPPCYYLLGSAAVCVCLCVYCLHADVCNWPQGCLSLEPLGNDMYLLFKSLLRRWPEGSVHVHVHAWVLRITQFGVNQSASVAGFPCRSIMFSPFLLRGLLLLYYWQRK